MVSLILPYVTRVTRGLSVMVFFILMAFAGLFVMIHQIYDQPIVVEQIIEDNVKSENGAKGSIERKVDATGNIIVEEGGNATTGQGTAKGGSLAGHGVVQFTETAGTIIFYIIIGIAFVALLFSVSYTHLTLPTKRIV